MADADVPLSANDRSLLLLQNAPEKSVEWLLRSCFVDRHKPSQERNARLDAISVAFQLTAEDARGVHRRAALAGLFCRILDRFERRPTYVFADQVDAQGVRERPRLRDTRGRAREEWPEHRAGAEALEGVGNTWVQWRCR